MHCIIPALLGIQQRSMAMYLQHLLADTSATVAYRITARHFGV